MKSFMIYRENYLTEERTDTTDYHANEYLKHKGGDAQVIAKQRRS